MTVRTPGDRRPIATLVAAAAVAAAAFATVISVATASDVGPGSHGRGHGENRFTKPESYYHDPIERLNFERRLFDSTSQSLGERTLTLMRESSEGGQYAIYSENVRWRLGPVVYIGLDVQGSNDNYPYPETDGESGAVITSGDSRTSRSTSRSTCQVEGCSRTSLAWRRSAPGRHTG
jgi:hypothetical protein